MPIALGVKSIQRKLASHKNMPKLDTLTAMLERYEITWCNMFLEIQTNEEKMYIVFTNFTSQSEADFETVFVLFIAVAILFSFHLRELNFF